MNGKKKTRKNQKHLQQFFFMSLHELKSGNSFQPVQKVIEIHQIAAKIKKAGALTSPVSE